MAGRIKKKIGQSFRYVTKSTVISTVEYKSSDLEIDIDVDAIVKSLSEAGARAVKQGLGSIGKTTQDGKHRQFTNTGTLINGIAVRSTGTGEADVVAPPDRLEEDLVFERMVDLVPVLKDPLGPIGAAPIHDAIEKAVAGVVKGGR